MHTSLCTVEHMLHTVGQRPEDLEPSLPPIRKPSRGASPVTVPNVSAPTPGGYTEKRSGLFNIVRDFRANGGARIKTGGGFNVAPRNLTATKRLRNTPFLWRGSACEKSSFGAQFSIVRFESLRATRWESQGKLIEYIVKKARSFVDIHFRT